MPFGKYRGQELADLPTYYLQWLAQQDWVEAWLATAVADELDAREGDAPPAHTTAVSPEVRRTAHEIIAAGFRSLALKCHPDHGGTHAAMVTLNAARDWLEDRMS